MKRSRQTGNSRKKRKRRLYIILAVWSVFAVIGVVTVVYTVGGFLYDKVYGQTLNGMGRVQRDEDVSEAADDLSESGIERGLGAEAEKGVVLSNEEQAECLRILEGNEELLLLVNKENALEEAYEPFLRNICNGRLQADKRIYDDLHQMLAAAEEDGYTYWFSSAYRSREYQQGLVDRKCREYEERGMSHRQALEKTYEQTMPAGRSEHETGLALDILCSGNMAMDKSQAEEAGNRWLLEHAHEYGFILRYPKDKEGITGIKYEPWHFRYVGREAAEFMWEHSLTLEEFYQNAGIE